MAHLTRQQILSYNAGSASSDQRLAVDEHLAGCDSCLQRLRALDSLRVKFDAYFPTREVESARMEEHGFWARLGVVFRPKLIAAIGTAGMLIVFLALTATSQRRTLKDSQFTLTVRPGHEVTLPYGVAGDTGLKTLFKDGFVPAVAPIQLALAELNQREVLLGASETNILALLSPAAETTRSTRPAFEWRPVPGASYYEFYLGTGKITLWTNRVQTTRLDLPASAPLLIPGSNYWWQVAATTPASFVVSDRAKFHVLTSSLADMAASVEQTAPSPSFARAAVYESLGLYSAARAELEALRALNRDDPLIREMLSRLGAVTEGRKP